MSTESRRTSFVGLTAPNGDDGRSLVDRIEIPLFQRDYAQGRTTDAVGRIRGDFLDVLIGAISGDEGASVGLDFVYGGVESDTLRPLDGQQRLTTLFLLHWYVASRSGNLTDGAAWTRFSYATRQSARMFCESLTAHPLPEGATPKAWITDQPWYLFVWRHDPTVQSMLVVLDAIDGRCGDLDPHRAWARLTDLDNPAIWFLFLPLSELGGTAADDAKAEELYIKMNSRGKPLTEFENFKARFERTIQWSDRASEFELKVDTIWSDLMWHLRDDDHQIDDQFLRYIEFVTEICEWRDGRADGAGTRLDERTRAVFGEHNPRRNEHLDLLFRAFDVWVDRSADEIFGQLFFTSGELDHTRVRLFSRERREGDEGVNLFAACCQRYGETRGNTRVFPLARTLLLHAVLLHLMEGTVDVGRRLRIVRNLLEASADELRIDRMPRILNDVELLIRTGAVDEVTTLNQAQVGDEHAKAEFLRDHPGYEAALFHLEDHELLRGSLASFELEPATFESRAATFRELWSRPELWTDLLGALLSVGEYQRQRTGARPFLFGTDSRKHDNAWRLLLTGPARDRLMPTRRVLGEFLDRVTARASDQPLVDVLRAISDEFLTRCEAEQRFDWRYYMVKYPAMRDNGSSTYFAERFTEDQPLSMGYSLCMLRAGGWSLRGYHRDPYLLTIHRELDDTDAVVDSWFMGSESTPRRMALKRSGASIRCVPAGFELTPPAIDEVEATFRQAAADIGADDSGRVAVPQRQVDDHMIDTEDRIELGATIVRRLLDAGL